MSGSELNLRRPHNCMSFDVVDRADKKHVKSVQSHCFSFLNMQIYRRGCYGFSSSLVVSSCWFYADNTAIEGFHEVYLFSTMPKSLITLRSRKKRKKKFVLGSFLNWLSFFNGWPRKQSKFSSIASLACGEEVKYASNKRVCLVCFILSLADANLPFSVLSLG